MKKNFVGFCRFCEAVQKLFPIPLSIDTQHFEVAKAAVDRGATIVNDVTGGMDSRMPDFCARSGCTVILMHRQGKPSTMQKNPNYPRGVCEEVGEFLRTQRSIFFKAGVPAEKIWLDPGIGFGKTRDHNFELLRGLRDISDLPGRIVIGTSRKRFLGEVLGDLTLPMSAREPGTLATSLWAREKGASVFRVHDVAAMKRALAIWEILANDAESSSRDRSGN